MNRYAMAGMVLSLLAGCASLERTSPGMMDGLDVIGGDTPAEQTVCVRNYGFGLFYICTAICGDVGYDRSANSINGGCLLFEDKCNSVDCYRTLQAVANREGKDLTNVNYFNNSLPSQGITGYLDFAGWFLEIEDVGCSGVLRAKKGTQNTLKSK